MISIIVLSIIGLLSLLYLLYCEGRKRAQARAQQRETEAGLKRAGV